MIKTNRKEPAAAKSNGPMSQAMKSNGRPHAALKSDGPGRVPAKSNEHACVPMRSIGEEAFRVFSASVARLVSQGKRTILITSCGPREGKSTITAALARKLARSSHLGVAVVDADTVRPKLHDLFRVENRRGLGDLLHDVYHVDLSRENPDQFGLGDWIDLIRAQSRTGKLEINEGSHEFSILFNKGKISSLFDHPGQEGSLLGQMLMRGGRISEEQCSSALRVQEEGSHPLGEVLQGLGYIVPGELEAVLLSQFKERLHKILTMRQPRYRFSEMVRAYVPAAAGSSAGDCNGSCIDRFVVGMAGDYLKQPYLSSQVPGYLKDAGMENLKVLTCGNRPYDLCDPHSVSSFEMVIDRLAKRFDVVLVDSPPVAFDTATASLARTVDGVLLVISANDLKVGVIQQAKEHLVRSGANILGVVLNQVDLFKDEAPLYYYQSEYR